MATIKLTQGLLAEVDDDLFEEINKYKWQAAYRPKRKVYYAQRTVKEGGKNKTIYMHRFIFELKGQPLGKLQGDHLNGVTLDNRWVNLRRATPQINGYNSKMQSNNTSGIKGVCWDKKHDKWKVRVNVVGWYPHVEGITEGQEQKHLGNFDNKEDALDARLMFFERPDVKEFIQWRGQNHRP